MHVYHLLLHTCTVAAAPLQSAGMVPQFNECALLLHCVLDAPLQLLLPGLNAAHVGAQLRAYHA